MPNAERRMQIQSRVARLYPEKSRETYEALCRVIDRHIEQSPPAESREWSEKDIALITYGGQIREPEKPPLQSLGEFLVDHQYEGLINTVHILPFFPFSSDDGFSVIDYRKIDPELGDWNDVTKLGEKIHAGIRSGAQPHFEPEPVVSKLSQG